MSTEPDFLNHYEPTCEQLEALTKAIREAEVGDNTHADDLFYSRDSNALPALREIIRSAEKAERERILGLTSKEERAAR